MSRRCREYSCATRPSNPLTVNSIEDLIALRKLRKAHKGIEATRLSQGDIKKRRRKTEDEEPQVGLRQPNARNADPGEGEESVSLYPLVSALRTDRVPLLLSESPAMTRPRLGK